MQQRFFDELSFSNQQIEDIRQAEQQFGMSDRHEKLRQSLSSAIEERDAQAASAALSDGLQTFGPVYPLYLIQSCYDQVFRLYTALGIETSVRVATLSDIRLWTQTYADSHSQKTGLTQVFWIARHLCAKIQRLGRLQYEPRILKSPFRIYKQRGTDTIVTLAQANLACDQEGYLTTIDKAAFITSLEEDDSTLLAHGVDGTLGSIACKPAIYDKASLILLADSQTEVLYLHIPQGERLSKELVDDSLNQARVRFPNHSLVVCSSWLLDPALARVTEPSSNIVQFMERFSKFPVPFQTPQMYERVFGFTATEQDIPLYKATTTLQRAVQSALSEGVTFRTMGGSLLLVKLD